MCEQFTEFNFILSNTLFNRIALISYAMFHDYFQSRIINFFYKPGHIDKNYSSGYGQDVIAIAITSKSPIQFIIDL